MISNSGSDERGKYSGGQAGDQTGNEWQIIPWYNRPWNCVLRHPSATTREWIATLAEEAANNDKIGYDQNQRTTFWGQLKASGYRPKNITQPCEADCSSGVAAIVKAAGYMTGDTKLQNVSADMYTGNERSILMAAGFDLLTAKKYLSTDRYIVRGDILLYEYHHTAINLTDGALAVSKSWHWVKSSGKWYYQDTTGANKHGWQIINETAGDYAHKYYFDSTGAMVKGLRTIDGKLYYFHESLDNYEGALCTTDSAGALDVMYLDQV